MNYFYHTIALQYLCIMRSIQIFLLVIILNSTSKNLLAKTKIFPLCYLTNDLNIFLAKNPHKFFYFPLKTF